MAVPHADIADLAKLAFFRGFDEEALCLVAGLGDLRNVEAGTTFLHQGEKGESMYVLIEGSVAIRHRAEDGTVREMARVGAGSFFGEVALMDAGPRCADVVTLEPCRILEISHGDIAVMAMGNETVALKLFLGICRELVDRSREANERYVEALAQCGK